MVAGSKVILKGPEGAGFGEVAGGEKVGDCIEVRFSTNAVSFLSVMAPRASVHRALLPAQTRCFQQSAGVTRYGRVIACGPDTAPLRTYLVQFAGEKQTTPLLEDRFAVRSSLPQTIRSKSWRIWRMKPHSSSSSAARSYGNYSGRIASAMACRPSSRRRLNSCNIRWKSQRASSATQRFDTCLRMK